MANQKIYLESLVTKKNNQFFSKHYFKVLAMHFVRHELNLLMKESKSGNLEK